jgi:hypothetical protein
MLLYAKVSAEMGVPPKKGLFGLFFIFFSHVFGFLGGLFWGFFPETSCGIYIYIYI